MNTFTEAANVQENILYDSVYDIPLSVWYSSDSDVFYEALVDINDSACKTGLSQKVCSDALRKLGCINSFCLRQVDKSARIEPKNEGSKPKFMKQAIISVTVLEREFNLEEILKQNLSSKVSYNYSVEPSVCIHNDRYNIALESSNKAELVKSVMNLITTFYNDDAVSSEDMSVDIDLPSIDAKSNVLYISDWQKLSLYDKLYNLEHINARINIDNDEAFDELRMLFEILYYQFLIMKRSDTTQYIKKVNISYIDNSHNNGFELNKQFPNITDNLETMNSKVQNVLNRLYTYVHGSINTYVHGSINISKIDFFNLMCFNYSE